jgi:hypothetical protein
MEIESYDNSTKSGTIGGTAFVLLLKLNPSELGHTALLAIVGAVTSFCISVTLRYLFRKFHRK